MGARRAVPPGVELSPHASRDPSAAVSVTGSGAVRDSAVVAGWTALSRVTGLARVVVIAAVLGASYFGNLYQSANLLPNILFEFLTGPLIASLIVPAIVGHIDRGDSASVHRVAGGFLGCVLVVFCLVAILVAATGPLVLRALTVGVSDPSVVTEYIHTGWLLLALLIPQVLLYAVVGTGVAVQNAHGQFAFPAAAPLIENLGIMATLAAYALVFGTGTRLEDVHTGHLVLLGLGTTSAVAAHAAAQWWAARRVGVTLRPRAGWRDPDVRSVLALTIPSLGYAMLNAARQFGALMVGSSVAGGVIAFGLAMNFYNLPVALGGRPVAQANLPRLARAEEEDEAERLAAPHQAGRRRRMGPRYRQTLGQALALSMMLTVPAGVGLMVLAEPLAVAVSYGQMQAMGGTALLAAALLGLGLGVIGETAFILGTQASYARRNAMVPLRVALVRTGVSASIMIYCLSAAVSGPTLLLLLGAAVTAGDLLAALFMWTYLRVESQRSFGARRDLILTLISAVLLVLVASAVRWQLSGWLGGSADVLPAVAVVTVGTVTGALVYGLAQHLLGSSQWREVLGLARGRGKR